MQIYERINLSYWSETAPILFYFYFTFCDYEIEIVKNEKNVRKMVEVIHNTMMRT